MYPSTTHPRSHPIHLTHPSIHLHPVSLYHPRSTLLSIHPSGLHPSTIICPPPPHPSVRPSSIHPPSTSHPPPSSSHTLPIPPLYPRLSQPPSVHLLSHPPTTCQVLCNEYNRPGLPGDVKPGASMSLEVGEGEMNTEKYSQRQLEPFSNHHGGTCPPTLWMKTRSVLRSR